MNILKHMEAAFIIALAVAGVGSVVAAHAHNSIKGASIQESRLETPAKIPVVVVTGKRPTPAQKLEMRLNERRAAGRA